MSANRKKDICMYFMIDAEGTLDKGTREEWKELFELMRTNGHHIVLATGGPYDEREEQIYGFEKSYFDRVFSRSSKNKVEFYEFYFAEELGTTVDQLCLIDDYEKNVEMAQQAKTQFSHVFKNVRHTRDYLIEQQVLKVI